MAILGRGRGFGSLYKAAQAGGRHSCFTLSTAGVQQQQGREMSSSREQFLYGAIVGAGAVALGAGAFLATSGLWCASRRQPV